MSVNTSFLNGTRFFLALWVAISHFYAAIGAVDMINLSLLGKVIMTAGTAVDLFMVITGFLMAYHYFLRENKEPYELTSTKIKFITRRFFRLYPVYFVAITLAFLLNNLYSRYLIEDLNYFTGSNMTPWGAERTIEQLSIGNLLSHLTFIHGLIPAHVSGIIGAAWSLSLEIQFYLLFPLLFVFLFAGKNANLKLSSSVIVSAVISFFTPSLFGNYLEEGLFSHFGQPSILIYKLPLFLLGMVIAATMLKKTSIRHLYITLVFTIPVQSALTIAFLTGLIILFYLDHLKPKLHKIVFNPIDWMRSFLSKKVFELGADLSYSFYLIHMVTIPFVIKLFITAMGDANKLTVALSSFVAFLAFTLLLCYLLHRFIEKPFIKIGRSISFNKSVKEESSLLERHYSA